MVVRLMIMDDARMLARVGVFSVVGRLVAAVIKEGALIRRAIVTGKAGHCRPREENLYSGHVQYQEMPRGWTSGYGNKSCAH